MPLRIAASLPWCLLVAVLVVAGGASSLAAQTLPQTPRPVLPGADLEDDLFHTRPELRERLEHAREVDRYRRTREESGRLLDLTKQYQLAIQAHGSQTEEDRKLLLQIEKLARSVRDRMRGQ